MDIWQHLGLTRVHYFYALTADAIAELDQWDAQQYEADNVVRYHINAIVEAVKLYTWTVKHSFAEPVNSARSLIHDVVVTALVEHRHSLVKYRDLMVSLDADHLEKTATAASRGKR